MDGDVRTAVDIPNEGFETPSQDVGTPIPNRDFESAPARVVSLPNNDFEMGNLDGWTVAGSPTLENDATRGRWAKFSASGQSLTTQAFTVPQSAQAVSYDIGYLTTSGWSGLYVHVLSGATFGTSTQIAYDWCSGCNKWARSSADLQAYRGQTIKLRFSRADATVGLDDVAIEEVFPGFDVSGKYARQVEDSNHYAWLDNGATLTTPSFTVDGSAQQASVKLKGRDTGAQWEILVATGPTYSTFTVVKSGYATTAWQDIRFTLDQYRGQSVKVRVRTTYRWVAWDDVTRQVIEVPQWSISDTTRLEQSGTGDRYVSTRGPIVSAPLSISDDADNYSFTVKSGDGTTGTFYADILSGPDFSTINELDYTSTPLDWKEFRFSVGQYTGQTIKLRIRRYSGAPLWISGFSDIEATVDGWKSTQPAGFVSGADAHGSYIAPAANTMFVRSSWVSAGNLAATESRWYTVTYDLQPNALLTVYWVNEGGTTQSLTAVQGSYRTKYFSLLGGYGTRGYFIVKITGGAGKVYAIADNIARQQISDPSSRRVGLGIDTSSGAFAFADNDIASTATLPLTFTRYFNSHSDRLGTMGYRWTHTFDSYLVFGENDYVGVVLGSGRQEFFDLDLGVYKPVDPRIHSTLVKKADGTFAFTTKQNITHSFSADGALTRTDDLNGNYLSIARNASGNVSTVTDVAGNSLTFGYGADGRLTSVTDPTAATYTYGYSSDGDLTTVTDPEGGVRRYTYSRHQLTKVNNEIGALELENVYNRVGRVTSQTDAAGHTIALAYDTPGKGATRVTDPEGGQATYYFDRMARTTHAVDPTGSVLEYLYDANGNLDKIIDPATNSWDFAFDSSADLLSTTDPLGNPSSFTYNPKHLPTTVTDARGNVTTFAYDSAGNVTSITDALGKTKTFTYDSAGHVTSETNELGKTTTYTYDPSGNKTSMTDALGKTRTYTYDAAGRLKTETDPLNNTTTYFYDLLGRIIKIRDPLGSETHYLYDGAGHLLRVTDPLGNETLWAYNDRGLVRSKTDAEGKVTTYLYDANRNMTSVADPLGRTTTYAYDDANRLTSITDPAGKTTSYEYDPSGRLKSKTDPLNRKTSYTYDQAAHLKTTTLPNNGVLTYGYDANGNLTSVADPGGHSTLYTYDAVNRLTSERNPVLDVTQYGYDAAGQLTSQTINTDEVTTFTYDAAGRRKTETDPLGNTTQHTYDAAGRLVSVTDPTNRSTAYTYDAVGQTTAVTDPAGHATTNEYDFGGNLKSVTAPSGARTTYAYDKRGLTTSITDPLLRTTSFSYDAAGQLLTETNALSQTTSYGYDSVGRQTSITDPLNGAVTFGYDVAGQMTSVTDPRGKTWTYTYDALGNRKTVTDPLDRTTQHGYDIEGQQTSRTDARGTTTSYAYDASGQLSAVTYPGGETTYAYDDAGRRTSMVDPTGTTTYGYDDAGRTSSVAAPAGTVNYGYDDAGRRTSMSLPGARTANYSYNSAGRMASVTDWANRTAEFGYDVDGNRTSITRPNGVTSDYDYDAAGQIESIAHKKGAQTLLDFSYTYDADGNRTSVTTSDGTEGYSYDAVGRLTQVAYPGGSTTSYTYDKAGNRLTETTGGNTTNYIYDAAGQLTSAGSKSFTYDANGNLKTAGSDSFSWDWDNRLTDATGGTHSATYRYDGDGVRVKSTVDGTSKDLTVDRVGGLPTVVDDGTNAYIHADGVAAEVTGTSARYPLGDGLGSVRGVTDGTGAVIGSTSYDAFGATRASSGTQSTFGFTGEPSDATGLTYLRARYLDPGTGRMLSADTVQPNAPGTQGYNLYAYVANNPTSWIDTTGHFATSPAGPITLTQQAQLGLILGSITPVIYSYAALCVANSWGCIGLGILGLFVMGAVFTCINYDACITSWLETHQTIERDGAVTTEGKTAWPAEELDDAIESFPATPTEPDQETTPLPPPTNQDKCGLAATFSSCDLPVFMPGGDTPATTTHIVDALRNQPAMLTRAAHPDSTTSRQWYRGDSRCAGETGDALSCDEYPFFSTRQGGPGASLRLVPGWEQDLQGGRLSAFYSACGIAPGDDFLVRPMPQPVTTFAC